MTRRLLIPTLLAGLLTISACGGSSSDEPAASSDAMPDADATEMTCTDRALAAAGAGTTAAERGQLFLEANAQCEGVTTTESGLQYTVIEQGDGDTPESTSVVRVHYAGSFLDGSEFDSSYDRGEPAEFPLNRVIPGWTEGVGLMAVGSTYRLFIPSDLAYGPGGRGPIGPNETLIFQVELLDITG